MHHSDKNKFKPLLEQIVKLRGNIQNRKKLLNFKKKMERYNTILQRKIKQAFYELKLTVPMLTLLISILFLIIYNHINNPYTAAIQRLVFISILILNIGIFSFYKSETKLSFTFFVANCLILFMYIRLSTNVTFPICLIYYMIIFIGYHIFHETFTKIFFLRSKIIIRGYYKNSEFIKIFLWFFLILCPSLIKHPIIIYIVYQPLMVYFYLSRHDYILLFLCLLFLWCLLLVFMNKYNIGRNFLEKCKTYFSRRGCLHYLGN